MKHQSITDYLWSAYSYCYHKPWSLRALFSSKLSVNVLRSFLWETMHRTKYWPCDISKESPWLQQRQCIAWVSVCVCVCVCECVCVYVHLVCEHRPWLEIGLPATVVVWVTSSDDGGKEVHVPVCPTHNPMVDHSLAICCYNYTDGWLRLPSTLLTASTSSCLASFHIDFTNALFHTLYTYMYSVYIWSISRICTLMG